MLRTLLVTTIALVLTAAFAEATVIAVHDGGVPVAGLPGYLGYTVSLESDTADAPAGFEGDMDGPMNQILAFGVLDTPTLTFADLLPNPEQDSHFLVYDGDIVAAVGPNETSVYLGGAFALIAHIVNPLPLAYLVIQDGEQVHVTGVTGDAAAQELFPVDLWVPIPEPLTLTLLGLGGLALLRRRA